MISVFDLFKIGIGPSSSHTVGPMVAANRFLELLGDDVHLVNSIRVDLYGSLSATGKGHATDTAVMLGLLGHQPRTIDTTKTDDYLATIMNDRKLLLGGVKQIAFNYDSDIVWYDEVTLPHHPNGMSISAFFDDDKILSQTYYSIGGGFVVDKDEIMADEPGAESGYRHIYF